MPEFVQFLGKALIITIATAVLVMVLAIFFKWLPRLGPKRPTINVRAAAALFEEGRFFDVLLSSGERLRNLQFEGIVQADAEAGWSLSQLAVMRRRNGGKVILRIDSVRVFEEVAPAPSER
ncbi:MAG: hypothetical protein ACKOED_11150 [Aestuariivirga sp.]|uniref:hypothetical protein n=1 Tax=Aestuariivirga sp. TaxID=2650926 RepID=UPI0038D154EE